MSSLNRHLLPPRTLDDLVPSPSSAPSWFGEATETVADLGVLVLVALCLGHGIRALRRGPVETAVGLVAAAAAATAYLISEALKVLFTRQRPCHVEERLLEVTGCPPVSDYAFPSNHATIAAALAAAAVLMAPRIWRLVVVLVATVGAARVLGGMHYLHDVLAGVLLGWALVSSAVHLLARRAAVALTRLATRSWALRILPSWQRACRSEVERYTDRDGRA
jgi:undecaprenyl-diphosphatase